MDKWRQTWDSKQAAWPDLQLSALARLKPPLDQTPHFVALHRE